ncbi:hypothetical protein [Streptomyces sp. NPDC057557]|uniref:hypothetical protein n=2 Tax=unclassified Streptomyces TaxID=2593676 RepID=UPI003698A9C6
MHMQECEAEAPKRAFTRDELQTFFDHADDQVERVRGRGRKGWLPAFRDAMLFKTAYAFGLRRNETRMLDTADFGRNPEGAEFGEFGICYVRHGKAKKGSPPKRRSVLTVWEWSADILDRGRARSGPPCGTRTGQPCGLPNAGGEWACNGWTPVSPPTATISAWTRSWTSTCYAGLTSPI